MQTDLFQKDIDQLKCVAQSYDGASVMSGKHAGVQALFKQMYPGTVYVHCSGLCVFSLGCASTCLYNLLKSRGAIARLLFNPGAAPGRMGEACSGK